MDVGNSYSNIVREIIKIVMLNTFPLSEDVPGSQTLQQLKDPGLWVHSVGISGIHSWQHWLSLPLPLLYLLALSANILILIITNQEATLHRPMYSFLGILAVVTRAWLPTSCPRFWSSCGSVLTPSVSLSALCRCMSYIVLWAWNQESLSSWL